jgi:DNA-binding beta-propeller fold protein YncE
MRHTELLVIPLVLAAFISGSHPADPVSTGASTTVWYQRDNPVYQGVWVARDIDPQQGISLYGMARATDGSFYLCDSDFNRLQKFSSGGQFLKTVGSEGSAPGQLDNPHAIRFRFDGNYWVVETDNNRLQLFSATDTPLGSFGGEGSNHGQFNEPRDVAIAADGSLWVADTDNDRLEHFDATGKYIGTVGGSGSGTGKFYHPRGIGIDYAGRLYVTDSQNARVQVLSPTGAFIRSIGSYGTGTGQFNVPYHIAVWLDGSFYVSDNNNHRVQHFDPSGKFLSYWGRADCNYGIGQGEFAGPIGIVVDLDGTVHASDRSGRVQRFVPKVYPTGGKTVTLAGTIAGLGKKEQKRVRVVAVGVVKGVTFFAIATPSGKTNAFSFSGFPKRAPYTIYVTGYDTQKLVLTPATRTGKAKKDVSDIAFTLAK